MALTEPQPPRPLGAGAAFIVYICYLVGLVLPLAAIAGLIVAYAKRGEGSEMADSHFLFQIRTFWMGLLVTVVGWLLTLVLIGWLVLLVWAIWLLARCITGMLRIGDHEPVRDPLGWGFAA
ncbi:MAG: DUF4870 domain-containing protein [Pseudomonadota bacterium]